MVLAVGVAVWAAGLVAMRSGGQRQGTTLVVEAPGSETESYPLSSDRMIRIEGPLGVTEIEIAADRARVVRAPCRNEICVAAGWIGRAGEVTVCIPNQVLLRLEGHRPPRSHLDGVSR